MALRLFNASPVTRALQSMGANREVVVHTGQHYDHGLSAVFFDEMGLPLPDYNLGIGSHSHGDQTGRMLSAIERVFSAEQPDWVLVYGDTNSTLAGALAASKMHIRVAHVEAGLRSFNRRMPEEINRILTDHVSDLLFAPTPAAVNNLEREGIRGGHVYLVGDVMYDAVLQFASKVDRNRVEALTGFTSADRFALVTVHRAENTDDPNRLSTILGGLAELAGHIRCVMPLHPRTRKAVQDAQLDSLLEGHTVIDPVGYLDMVALESTATLIVTDSGGVQKEALFHGVPCVTLRPETEWTETVEVGWNHLVDPLTSENLVATALHALETKPGFVPQLYGDGSAAHRIAEVLVRT
jgi:UDP-GlcNAc3NAcA epimerase